MKYLKVLFAFLCLFLALNKTNAYTDSYFLWEQKCVSDSQVLLWKVYYSTDNKQYAYLTLKNNKQVLILNWKELNYFSNYTLYGFVNNWKDLLFSTYYNWKEVLFAWTKQIWAFDNLYKDSFVVSNTWNSYMISWILNQKNFLIKDSRFYNVDVVPGQYWYSPDSLKYYYYYKTSEWVNLVFNWRFFKNYKIFWSQKTSNYIFIKYYKTKKAVVYYWKEAKSYDDISNFIFSDNGRQYAFIGKDWDKTYLVINWVEYSWFTKVEGLFFSPNSKNFVFYGLANWKVFYYLNWQVKYPDINSIKNWYFTSNNDLVFVVSDRYRNNFFLVNWVKNYNYTDVENLNISRTTQNIWFFAKDWTNNFVLNTNWVKTNYFKDVLSLEFANNSSKAVWIASDKTKYNYVFVDKFTSKPYVKLEKVAYNSNLSNLTFVADNSLVTCQNLENIYNLSSKQKQQVSNVIKIMNNLSIKDRSYYKIQLIKKMTTYQKDTLQYDLLKMIYQNIN